MKKLPILLTVAAGIFGSTARRPEACGQNAAPPFRGARPANATRIAFVDMREVLRKYQKSADSLQSVQALVDAENDRIKDLVGQGQELEKPLHDGTLDRESPEFIEREKKVLQLSATVGTLKAVKERELKKGEARAMLELHRDVTDAVRQFAEQNEYTLVLRVDREAEAARSYTLISQTLSQTVLRHEEGDDITDAVIAWLNKQYTASGGAARPPTAPGNSRKTPVSAKAPLSKSASPAPGKSSSR